MAHDILRRRKVQKCFCGKLEVETYGDVGRTGVRIVERVFPHIGQTEVVSRLYIELIDRESTSHADTRIETFEIVIILIAEAAVRLAILVILDFASHATREEATHKRFDRHFIAHISLVLEHHRELEVVEVVREFLASCFTLPTLLRIVDTRLKVDWSLSGETYAHSESAIESRSRFVAIEVRRIGVDRSDSHTEAYARISIRI